MKPTIFLYYPVILKKALIPLIAIFFVPIYAYASILLERESFVLDMDTYLRTDLVALGNVVDLDSHNSADHTVYLGLDYSLGFLSEFKERNLKFYLKLERNGPFDYDAPIFVHKNLMTSGGIIEEYRNDELLPALEEFWLDTALWSNFRFKAGLYTYQVGNAFSLNGSYENYGAMIYKELENFSWRLCYHRPDLVYKNHLGPKIHQEEEQGIEYNHNAANFFATDAKFNIGAHTFWPYVGALADYTAPEKRDNAFSAPIKRDILGTLGMAYTLKYGKFSFDAELARNFGKAESADSDYKDVYHCGYLIYTALDYNTEKFIPSLCFLVASGNKVTPEMAENEDTTLTSGKNRAFSQYSPLNQNMGDSIGHNHTDIRPMVATGAGYGINYGVPRPATFSSTDLDNLIMLSLGFDFNITERFSLGLYGYYLRSFTRPVGMFEDEAQYLSSDLGYESDLFLDYKINKNVLVSLSGGYFLPGKYYQEHRDDTSGRLFNPFVRGDQDADLAYQWELSLEFTF